MDNTKKISVPVRLIPEIKGLVEQELEWVGTGSQYKFDLEVFHDALTAAETEAAE